MKVESFFCDWCELQVKDETKLSKLRWGFWQERQDLGQTIGSYTNLHAELCKHCKQDFLDAMDALSTAKRGQP